VSLSAAFPDSLAFRERHGRSPSPERAYLPGAGEEDKPNPLADTAARVATRAPQRPPRARPPNHACVIERRVYRVRGRCGVGQLRSASGRCRAPAGPKRPGGRQQSGRSRSALPEKGLTCGGVRAGRRSLWFGKGGRAAFIAHGEWATSIGTVRSTNEMSFRPGQMTRGGVLHEFTK
jgi:hypothetical protein